MRLCASLVIDVAFCGSVIYHDHYMFWYVVLAEGKMANLAVIISWKLMFMGDGSSLVHRPLAVLLLCVAPHPPSLASV